MPTTAPRTEPLDSRKARSIMEHALRRLYTHVQRPHKLYTPITDLRFVCPYYPVLSDEHVEDNLYEDVGAAPDILLTRPETDDIQIYVFSGDSVETLARRLRDGTSHRGKRVVVTRPPYKEAARAAIEQATNRPTPPSWFVAVAELHGGHRRSSADGGDIPIETPRSIRTYYQNENNGAQRQRYVLHKPSRYYAR